jgi:peroxiredoxin
MTTDNVLGDRIAAFQTQLAATVPAQLATAIATEVDGIVRSRAGAKAPGRGDVAPPFALPDVHGTLQSLPSLLETGPVVLAFYRGQWCPYCDLQLRAYQEQLPRMRELGATLVAISPQTPDASLSTADKLNLAFPVLADTGNAIARSYGLVFTLSPTMDALQRGFGVELARINGDTSNELPVPGTFVIGQDGRIAFAYVEPDFRKRVEPAELIRQLERLRQ